MKDLIKYNGFIGSVNYSDKDEVFHGKLEGINDLVTFEGSSVKELKAAMKEAVEDYLYLCKKMDKDPHKSYKGSFNVRISPHLHERAAMKSTEEGVSLNKVVEKAIQGYLSS